MTTSVSSGEISTLPREHSQAISSSSRERSLHRIEHSLASRFLFLTICTAIILSTLAYGTVHYWALSLFNLGALAILLLWAADSWRLKLLRISRNVLQLPLLGLIALGAIQLLPLRPGTNTVLSTVEPARTLSLDPYSTRLVLVQLAALLVYFSATLVFTDTPRRLRLLVRTIIIFGFLLAVFGLTQSFTSPTKVYWFRDFAQSTPFGPFINRHHFAGYMELTISLPLGLLFAGSLQKEKAFIYLFAAVLMGVALIMTGSRGGMISVVAEIIFLAVLSGFRRKYRTHKDQPKRSQFRGAALRATLAFALIIGVFLSVLTLGGEWTLSRFVGTVNTEDPTTGRSHFWSVTVEMIKSHPVIGTGLGAFGVAYTRYDSRNGLFRLEQAHNDYLQVLSDSGILGAALGLFFIAMLFRIALKRCESSDPFRRGVAIGALSGCFAVLIHSFFDFTLHTTSNALLFLVLAALATLNGRVEEVQRRRRRRTQTGSTKYSSAVIETSLAGNEPSPNVV